ncbi:MAG: G5 domain-containing protein [Oscillibacter sp.]|nr:G5 domain-containing protein [Oscillibacter sp.]
MSPICYFFYFFSSFLQGSTALFSRKVGDITPQPPQKLDKSGKPVYTSPSFPIGNKSYKLFSFRKTPRYRPSKTREDWHGRPFLRRYLILNTHAFEKKLRGLKARFGLQLFVLAAVICTSWIVTDHANAVYILTGPEDAAIVLNEEEVREGEMSSQLVYLSSGQSGYDMALTAGQEVTVTHDGSTVTAKARSETVAELLERLHITPSPLEMVAVDLDEDSAELTIASELTYYDQVEEPAAYETVRVANPSLPKGTEKVVQEGADGVRTSIYEVVWSGGEEISRQFVEELESTAVNKVVEYGTAVASTKAGVASVSKNADGSGTLTLTDGTTLNFSGVKSMTATAYTAGHGGADYTTATGTLVKVGTVAVDKNVIPLGTKMYIVAADGSVVYGTAVAADTGVRGNIVDLYYDTYQQCINFGRRTCNVYILE